MTRFITLCLLSLVSVSSGFDFIDCHTNIRNPYDGNYTRDSYAFTRKVSFDATCPPGGYQIHPTNVGTATKTTPLGEAQTVTISSSQAVVTGVPNGEVILQATIPTHINGPAGYDFTISNSGVDRARNTEVVAGGPGAPLPDAQVVAGSFTIAVTAGEIPREVSWELDLLINKAAGSTGVRGPFLIELLVDGDVRQSGTVPELPQPGPTTLNLVQRVGPETLTMNGFTWAWRINGATVASGAVGAGEEVPDDLIYSNVTITDGTGAPPEEPEGTGETVTTTTTQNPDGSVTTTTTGGIGAVGPGAGGNPTTGAGTSSVSTAVNGGGTLSDAMTKQDFYDAFKRALADQANEDRLNDAFTPGAGPVAPTLEGADFTERGRIDETTESLDSIVESREAVETELGGKLDELRTWVMALPKTFGKKSELDLGTFTVLGRSFQIETSLETGPVGTKIPVLRAMQLVVMTILFMIALLLAIPRYL